MILTCYNVQALQRQMCDIYCYRRLIRGALHWTHKCHFIRIAVNPSKKQYMQIFGTVALGATVEMLHDKTVLADIDASSTCRLDTYCVYMEFHQECT